MKSEKDIAKLEAEFGELIKPRSEFLIDIKHIEERGAEIISELIDNEILKKLKKIAEDGK